MQPREKKSARLFLPILLVAEIITHFGFSVALADHYPTQPSEDGSTLEEIVVSGRGDDLAGEADSATKGTVGAKEIKSRPIARPGEVLETVPGLIITQHAGGGKANQYYLRGFNLDHGTDFATFLDGVPLNLLSHAHGQGYTDVNWLIPELVQGISYEKGVYYADQGDFANAGAANVRYFDVLPHDLAEVEAGGLGFYRGIVAGSPKMVNGHLLYAIEAQHFDGAWAVPMNYRRYNGVLKYSVGDENSGYSLSAQGYSGKWLGNEQVPERAIKNGTINPFSSLDRTTGGNTDRYSLYGDWHRQDDESATNVVAYVAKYHLDLYSNFTYFLDQTNGDQIYQRDSRIYAGVRAQHEMYGKLFGKESDHTLGLQVRQDWADVSLDHTQSRQLVTHVRTDHVSQLNIAPWYQNKIQWLSWLRSIEGVRGDLFHFKSDSDTAVNSGSKFAGVVSPKLSLIFGPWDKTEYYIQGGLGFRTNDVRGIFSTIAPDTGGLSRPLPAIVHTRGAEIGVRTSALPNLNSTVSLWSLWSDSDTFYAGDAGSIVDADRPGVRYGVEWTNFYSPLNWLTLDADFAFSTSRFTDNDPLSVGKYMPQSVTSVIAAGISVKDPPGLLGAFFSLRLRQFGPRPLIEDNSQKSLPSAVINLKTGYHFNNTWTGQIEVLNLFDTKYNDNEYYYSSRLNGEAAGPEADGGTNDHMVHAGEPRSVRATLVARF